MSTGGDSTIVRLPVHLTPDYAGTLEIQFGPEIVQRYHLEGQIRLSVGPQRLQCWYRFYGHNVHTFCDELENLRQTLQGSARLHNWDWDELLCFSAADRRGTIVVGGRFDAVEMIGPGTPFSETNFLATCADLGENDRGTCSFFDGFLLDQSDLVRAISAMRRFLNENEVVTGNPDGPDFDWRYVRSFPI